MENSDSNLWTIVLTIKRNKNPFVMSVNLDFNFIKVTVFNVKMKLKIMDACLVRVWIKKRNSVKFVLSDGL